MYGKSEGEAYGITEEATQRQAKETRARTDISEAAKDEIILAKASVLDKIRNNLKIKD